MAMAPAIPRHDSETNRRRLGIILAELDRLQREALTSDSYGTLVLEGDIRDGTFQEIRAFFRRQIR